MGVANQPITGMLEKKIILGLKVENFQIICGAAAVHSL